MRGEERACPFCASPLRSTRGPWNGTAAVVIAVGSVLFACGPAVSDTGDTIETSSTEDGVESTTGSAEVSTGAGTTVPPTTDPTMAMTSTTSLGDTSTGGSTTWEDDTFDTACGFYGGCPTDVGDMPYECDVFMQDCPDGQRCNPWADDGGNVWNLENALCQGPETTTGDRSTDPCGFDIRGIRNSWGFGFRWFSPLGPLRFEWGIPINRKPWEDKIRFEFTIGNSF